MSYNVSEIRVELRQVVADIAFLLGRVLPKSISVRTELPSDLRPIAGDSAQISQMLLNLCINARDAMPDGGVLTIAAANPPFEGSAAMALNGRSGHYIHLTVSDTGSGIPAYAMDRIFDPSFSTKVPGSGRGSGLSTVWNIVRKHQGMISVESPRNGGARFEIFLPALEVSKKPTLLIAEADADLRRAYDLICLARQIDLRTAADGLDCLDKLRDGLPNALIVDIDIPWGGGDGLLSCLRERFAEMARTVVVATGVASQRVISRRSGIPLRNCFPKPYRPSAVLNFVSGTLSSQTGR